MIIYNLFIKKIRTGFNAFSIMTQIIRILLFMMLAHKSL